MGSSKSKHEEEEQFLFTSSGNLYEYYEIIEQIGVGQAGLILKALDKKTQKYRTIKEFSNHKMLTGVKDDLNRQISILRKMHNPHVINIFEFCRTPFSDYLVYEHLEGQSLMELILTRLEYKVENPEAVLFDKPTIHKFMRDILYAISYCHGQKVVHNDICPDNFVFVKEFKEDEPSRIKLIDFGISVEEKNLEILKQRKFDRKYGQIHFRAPETFNDDYQKTWTLEDVSKRDVWGAGVIFYILLTGKPLVLGRKKGEVHKNLNDLIKVVQRVPIELNDQVFEGIDEESQAILRKMLELDPKERVTAQEVLNDDFRNADQEICFESLTATLKNIENFQSQGKIDRKIRSLVVSHLVRDEDKRGLEFKQLDRDQDGFISQSDLNEIFLKLSESDPQSFTDPESFTTKIMEKCDWNNDKMISYREFLTASFSFNVEENEGLLNEITEFFGIFRNGYLTLSELKHFIKGVDNKEWEEFLRTIDKDQNGVIDTHELRDYLIGSVFK